MPAIKGRYVFLSGPMSAIPNHNVGAFAIAHHQLTHKGGAAYVFDPAIMCLCTYGQRNEEMSDADYLADCLHELTARRKRTDDYVPVIPLKYDLLVSLPGWESSRGATIERQVAEAIGIEVCDYKEAVWWE